MSESAKHNGAFGQSSFFWLQQKDDALENMLDQIPYDVPQDAYLDCSNTLNIGKHLVAIDHSSGSWISSEINQLEHFPPQPTSERVRRALFRRNILKGHRQKNDSFYLLY